MTKQNANQITDLYHDVLDLLDFNTMHNVPMQVVSFTDDLMRRMPSYASHPEGCASCAYDDTYHDICMMIELLDYDVYWAYLKDFSFPHIKLLGRGTYVVEDEDLLEGGQDWGDSFGAAMLDIQRRICTGEVDLDAEIYDYYHVVPAGTEEWFAPFETYSLGEAAGKLGVSVSRASKMVEDRVLEGFRFGAKLLISAESVDDRIDYIERHGKPTRGAQPKDMPSEARDMRVAWTHACYEQAANVFEGRCSATKAAERVLEATGMNDSSAKMYVNAILGMLRGGEIGYNINSYTVDYCLDRILADYGPEALKSAQAVCLRQYESSKRAGRNLPYYRRLALKQRG